MTKNSKDEITWEAPEFTEYQKSNRWYVILTIVGILLLSYSLWQGDFLMFATFLLLLVATYVFARQKPKTIRVKLSGKGVTLNESEYPYSMLKSFWILYDPPEIKTLNFETSQVLNKELVVQIEDANPNEIKDYLTEFLPENFQKEESYSDKLMRRIKF